MDDGLLERLRQLRAEIAQIRERTQEYNRTPNPSLSQLQEKETLRGRLEEIVAELGEIRSGSKGRIS